MASASRPIFVAPERVRVLQDLRNIKVALLGDSHMRRTFEQWSFENIEPWNARQQHLTTLFFGRGGLKTCELQSYVHRAITWRPHIVIIQIGSNDLDVNSIKSKESYANPIFDLYRQFENEGIVTFVIGLPVRYKLSHVNVLIYQRRSRAANTALRKKLPPGRYIALPGMLYNTPDSYFDGVHFNKGCYGLVAVLIKTKIEELLAN